MKCTRKQEASRSAYLWRRRKWTRKGYNVETIDQYNRWCQSPASGGYNAAIFESGDVPTASASSPQENNGVRRFASTFTIRLKWGVKAEAAQRSPAKRRRTPRCEARAFAKEGYRA